MSIFIRFLPGLILLLVAIPPRTGDPFRSLSFKEAVAKAGKENKFIFIDFYTTWCGPCKMMDETTFPDARVKAWLNEKVVAVKFDADREVALAEKFNIRFYPTLLFLKPDGTEFDRISGFVPPDEFMRVARGVEKGESSLDRMRKEMEASGNAPLARMQFASALAQGGRTEEALKEYLWCLDHGVEKDPEFTEIRNSYLLMELFNLAYAYEPAHKALIDRAGAAESRLRAGKGAPADVVDLVSFNRLLDTQARTIGVYDLLVGSDPDSAIVKSFDPFLLDIRIAARRYDKIIAAPDTKADIAKRLEHLSAKPSVLTSLFWKEDAQQTAMRKAEAFGRLMGYYQAFVGVSDQAQAKDLAEKILKIDRNSNVLNGLAWSAYLSGKATEANVEQAEEALKASGGASMAVLDTLVRVLDQLGRKDEAIRRCREALAKAETEADKRMIAACLNDFGVQSDS